MLDVLASEVQTGDRLYGDAAYSVYSVRPDGRGGIHVATVRRFFWFAPSDVVTVLR